jgi:hypothetical protein
MSPRVNFPKLAARNPEVELMMALPLTLPLPSARRPERAPPMLMPILVLTTLPRSSEMKQKYLHFCLPMAHEI